MLLIEKKNMELLQTLHTSKYRNAQAPAASGVIFHPHICHYSKYKLVVEITACGRGAGCRQFDVWVEHLVLPGSNKTWMFEDTDTWKGKYSLGFFYKRFCVNLSNDFTSTNR